MNVQGKAPRIMVVDDDPDVVTVLSSFLKREGFVPVEAASGQQCLKIAGENHIDLILLDLMMPGMDGFEVIKALKNRPETADIPVIMVTARDDIDARAEGMRLGVSDFLAKPVFRKQLRNRIDAQLEMLSTSRATQAALNRFEFAARKRSG